MKRFPNPSTSNFPWVGHIGSINDSSDEDTLYLACYQNDIEVLGGWSNDNLGCTGYHQIALVRLVSNITGEVCYYALTTSGCSCPSPNETWKIDYGPGTLDEVRKWTAKASQSKVLLSYLTDEYLGF